MQVGIGFRPSSWGSGRVLGLLGWLFIPLVGAAYHWGPGQERLKYDATGDAIATAREAVAERHFARAIEAYDDALAKLPSGETATARRLRLERAKAMMEVAQLPKAQAELKGLIDELTADQAADPALLRETRNALAGASYYMTWLLRLEGLPRTEWEPEIEQARQHYGMLASTATDAGEATRAREDLASAIRLARMDLAELQGLPIPSQ